MITPEPAPCAEPERVYANIDRRVAAEVRAVLLARGDWMARQRHERAEAERMKGRREEEYAANVAWLLSATQLG